MPTTPMTKVLLYSGGMDSVALDALWSPDVRLYVDMGTGYTEAERERLPDDVVVVPLPLAGWERPDGIIPLRNLFLVAVAAQYGDTVAMAATAGDRVLDKSYEFAELATQLMSYLWQPQHWTEGKRVHVQLPVKHLTKRELLEAVRNERGEQGLQYVAERSFSCYTPTPTGGECGACKPCFRKWTAFACVGRPDLATDAEAFVRRTVLPQIADGSFGRRSEALDVLAALGVHNPDNAQQAAQVLLQEGPS